MKRDEYLMHRNSGSLEPIYEFYKEHHKGDFFLPKEDFFNSFIMWPPATNAISRVLEEYDHKFEISRLTDKNGNVIKFL